MKQLVISLKVILLCTLITGGMYPLMMTGFAQAFFPHKAGGSLILDAQGRVTGSELIGQRFSAARYFHGRPSASGYDAVASGGSNLGPFNDALVAAIHTEADAVRKQNALPADAKIPADLVTASGSGLDPHISLAAALLQVKRVAEARKTDETAVTKLVYGTAERQYMNIAGERFVNVVRLNRDLDAQVR